MTSTENNLSAGLGCEGLIQVNPFAEVHKHSGPKVKDIRMAKEKWGHQLLQTNIFKTVLESDIGGDGDNGNTENVPVEQCCDSDEALRSKVCVLYLVNACSDVL